MTIYEYPQMARRPNVEIFKMSDCKAENQQYPNTNRDLAKYNSLLNA